MKRIIILFIVLITVTVIIAQKLPEYVPGQAIIRLTDQAYSDFDYESPKKPAIITSNSEINSLFSELGIWKIKRLNPLEEKALPGKSSGMNRSFVVYFPAEIPVDRALSIFQSNHAVEYATPNYILIADVTPNDTYYNLQWGPPKVNMPEAWDIQKGNDDVRIAVLDVGFKLDHEDLSSKFSQNYHRDETDIDTNYYQNMGYTLVLGEDYTTPDNDPTTTGTHGTHVSGIAGAATNNNVGIAGIGWNSIVVPVRCGFQIIHPIYGNIGILETDDWIRALDWVRINKTSKVVNMSFGRSYIGGPNTFEEDAISAAVDSGIVICASSGNWNEDVGYPARYKGVIAVGATDQSDQRASFSNYGDSLSLVAPGVDIYSTYFDANGNSTYEYESGTSMAAPHVAGAAALILSQDSSLSPSEVKNILESSAEKVAGMGGQNFHVQYGYGRLDVFNALTHTQFAFQFMNRIQQSTNYGHLIVDQDVNNPIISGDSLSFDYGTNHEVRTAELPFIPNWQGGGTTQKHHRFYETNSDYSLNHQFQASSSTPTLQDAWFISTEAATIKTDLISGGQGDTIYFRDPWRYYQDGGDWQQSNQFISYSSPFIIENNDISDYGGVFLNQTPDPAHPEKPYYSVRAQQQLTVPFHGQNIKWYFQNWSGTDVQFQHSNQNETAVVFQQANAVAQANYKGHMVSSKIDATAFNNGHRLVKYGGKYYLVYEDSGNIYYTTSEDLINWSREILVNEYYPGEAYNPSITVDYGGAHIVFCLISGDNTKIYYRNIGGVTPWYLQIYHFSPAKEVHPVIETDGSYSYAHIGCVFEGSDGLYYCESETGGLLLGAQKIPGTSANSKFPSLQMRSSKWGIAYEQGSEIYYITYNSPGTNWSEPELISQTSWPNNNRHPCVTGEYTDYPYYWIAWDAEGNNPSWRTVVYRSKSGTYYNFESWLKFYYYPSIRSDETYPDPNMTLAYEEWYNHDVYYTTFDPATGKWDYPEMISNNGEKPSIATNYNHDPSDLVLTSESEIPYRIQTYELESDQENLTKQSIPYTYSRQINFDLVKHPAVTGASLNLSGEISVELFPYQTTNDTLPFEAIIDSASANKFFSSKPFTATADSLKIHFLIKGKNIIANLPNSNAHRFKLLEYNLKKANNGQLLTSIFQFPIQTLTSIGQDSFVIDKELSVNLRPFQGKTIVVEEEFLKRIGRFNPTFIEKYTILPPDSLRMQESLSPLAAGINTEILPDQFALLQNYPNPFNPTTTISFDLPEKAQVKLQIYDVTGRQIRTLTNARYPAGSHRLQWDGKDEDGNTVASGIYVYRIEAGNYTQTRKMMLLK